MEPVELKKKLLTHCKEVVEQRYQDLLHLDRSAQQAANEETKSSAGDKYETGRAMMHLEKERLAAQMSEVSKLRKPLELINPEKISEEISLGSLVLTEKSSYFISVSLGEVTVDGGNFFCISPVTPIARLLMASKVGAIVSFANQTFKIEEVY